MNQAGSRWTWIVWLGAGAALTVLILVAPLDILEYLSLHVIGEPPINGRTWTEGMDETGGPWGMRLIGIAGVWILILGILLLARRPVAPPVEREVGNAELAAYFVAAAIFGVVNVLIGYAWWDAEGPLGMGPLFPHSMAALAVFGLLPFVFRRAFHIPPEGMATSLRGALAILPVLVLIAFGYGLWSCLWHCCSFFAPKIVFFFLVTKLFQLWAVCSFFYGWGLKMLQSRWGTPAAVIVTGLCFGITYPWHTVGFAVAFAVFGVVLCDLARRADSYLAPMVLLYLAYNFHAGLPWHGADATWFGILPLSGLVLVGTAWWVVRAYRERVTSPRAG